MGYSNSFLATMSKSMTTKEFDEFLSPVLNVSNILDEGDQITTHVCGDKAELNFFTRRDITQEEVEYCLIGNTVTAIEKAE